MKGTDFLAHIVTHLLIGESDVLILHDLFSFLDNFRQIN